MKQKYSAAHIRCPRTTAKKLDKERCTFQPFIKRFGLALTLAALAGMVHAGEVIDAIFFDGFESNLPTPDLLVINPAVSRANLAPGQDLTIDATVDNQGSGLSKASTLTYHLSADNEITSSDSILGTDAIPELSPGSHSVQSLATTAPANKATYWVGACVDPVAGETNADNQCSAAVQIMVTAASDSDGDRLPDWTETNTGIYVDSTHTGTNPNQADTDGDGIKDGDEVLGTLGGLDLPGMGVSPLRKDLLLEYDWFDDSIGCNSHSHIPTPGAMTASSAAFASSPVTNPGGVSGINLINDFGQGGVFTGGNLINDADGVIAGGVNSPDFQAYKAANFATNRHGYFHYVLLPHYYNTNSTSSGQAELPGDDLIVSLYCARSDNNVSRTVLHEVGHNLLLHHGGNESCNQKPNYNSVMNYRYQFSGIDNNCTPPGDGVLSYSTGDRIDLNENNLNENNGTCGPGFPWDWNGNATIENPVTVDINIYNDEAANCGGTLTTLRDYNDWANLYFGGVGDADGAKLAPPEIITEQPVPAEYAAGNN